MNEKTEKDGTGKLQNSAGIAKTESSTAATCAQTSADADRASRTIPAAASRRLGAATALYALLYTICLYRNTSGITYPFFVVGTLLFLLLYRKVQGSIRQRQSAKEAYQGASVWGGRIFARYLRVFNS